MRAAWHVGVGPEGRGVTAGRQELPEGSARSGRQAVLCRTGAPAADGVGERIALRVRLPGAPPEVVLEPGGTVEV
ncbi:hypothetical protein [Streptomyces coeruleorubidus]|uniref:hypothetical protein n=1 Tax=Streptomyces coeruleorubidus TaxID=116188 RepID=UPI0033BDB879